MYVLQEYLISLAVVSLLGLGLFGAAVIGLVGKSAVDWLSASARHLPCIVSNASNRNVSGFGKNHQGPLAQS